MTKMSMYCELPNSLEVVLFDSTPSLNVSLSRESLNQFLTDLVLLRESYIDKITVNDFSNKIKMTLKRIQLQQTKPTSKNDSAFVVRSKIQYDPDYSDISAELSTNDLELIIHWLLREIVNYSDICLEVECHNSQWMYWNVM